MAHVIYFPLIGFTLILLTAILQFCLCLFIFFSKSSSLINPQGLQVFLGVVWSVWLWYPLTPPLASNAGPKPGLRKRGGYQCSYAHVAFVTSPDAHTARKRREERERVDPLHAFFAVVILIWCFFDKYIMANSLYFYFLWLVIACIKKKPSPQLYNINYIYYIKYY